MVNGFPSVNPGPVDQLSSNSIGKNYRPSIVTVPDTYGWNNTFCSWIGDLDGSGTWMNVYTYERQEGSSTINRYGVGAQCVSMNMDNGINYYLAWNQNSSYNQSPSSCINYVAGSNLSAKPLNTTGQCVQLSNGATSASMYVSSFYNSALPYYFQTSNSLTSTPQGNVIAQANAVSNTTSVSLSTTVPSGRGRGIAIDKGNTGFYYSIGDINVDGNLIDFVSTNKKTKYNNMDTLNNVLLSQPFVIKSNSVLSFSENSGAADTLAAAGILGANGYISFTVQVIDNASGSVLGTIKKVKFSSSNLQLKYKTSPYTLSTSGLGGKTGRLKIIVGTNLDSLRLALVEQYAGVSVSAMGQASTLAMQPTSASGVTLGSYPNPFNPSTNIRYQLIENSRVSIKVYDILGRQITTLVDGNKTAGQYMAVFDGSHHASGVYFVRMMVQGSSAQQIVKTLKIQMLK
ncbi:MAG: T9SS type A sorting domain-containing protein, partial [Bacteroidota bacterium]